MNLRLINLRKEAKPCIMMSIDQFVIPSLYKTLTKSSD